MPDDDDDNDDQLFAAARRVQSVLGPGHGERTRYIDPQSGEHVEARQRPRVYTPESTTARGYIDPQSGSRPIVRDVDAERDGYRNYVDPNTGDYYSIADESPKILRHESASYIDPQSGTRLPVAVEYGDYYDPSTGKYLSVQEGHYSDFSDMPEPKGTYIDPQSGQHVMPAPSEREKPRRDVMVDPQPKGQPQRFFIREPEPTPNMVTDPRMVRPRPSVDPPLRQQVTQKDEPKRTSRKG